MQGIRADMAVCIRLMKETQPDVHDHLIAIIPPELIVQSCLQTLFVNSGCSLKSGAMLPADTLLRLFDCLFLSCLHPAYPRPHAILLCTYMVTFGEASPDLLELELDEAGAVMSILHDTGQF